MSKRFGRRWLFRDLSFDLGVADSLAVIGANGIGKSTLLRLVAGVLTPTSGEVEFRLNGSAIPDEHRSFHVGYVAPYLQLYNGLTLRENLRFVQRVRGQSDEGSRLTEAMEQVGLAGRQDDLLATYSSGMVQRARFAVSLVVNPEVLLLDEPSSNLDEAGVAIARAIFEQQLADGKSVILATNSRDEMAWCASTLNIEDFAKSRGGATAARSPSTRSRA